MAGFGQNINKNNMKKDHNKVNCEVKARTETSRYPRYSCR